MSTLIEAAHSDPSGVSTFAMYDIVHALGEILSITTVSRELKECCNKKCVHNKRRNPLLRLATAISIVGLVNRSARIQFHHVQKSCITLEGLKSLLLD